MNEFNYGCEINPMKASITFYKLNLVVKLMNHCMSKKKQFQLMLQFSF